MRLNKHRRRFDSRPACKHCKGERVFVKEFFLHGIMHKVVSGMCGECSGTGLHTIDIEQNTGIIKK